MPIRGKHYPKMSESQSGKKNHRFGKTPWNKGIPRTEEEKKNISAGTTLKTPRGKDHPLYGKPGPCGIDNPNYGKGLFGKDNPNYRGGINPLHDSIRKCAKYLEWSQWIKEWDNYTCQHCGKYGGDLESHHIIPFSKLVENITSLEEADMNNELYDISNGITYCKECHKLLNYKGGSL